METLIINYHSTEKRFAYLRNNRVEKIVLDRPEERSLVGNIYYGTVTKVLPGMNAVFIDIGEEKNAYLHRDQIPSYTLAKEKGGNISSFVHQGEKLLVQVEKDATGTKGPKVTGIIEIQGQNLIYLPKGQYVAVSKKIADESKKTALRNLGRRLKTEEEGLIFRTSSLTCKEEEIQKEIDQLRITYQDILHRAGHLKKPGVLVQKDSFTEMIIDQVLRMSSGEVIVDDLPMKKLLEEKNARVTCSYYNGKENIFSTHRIEHEINKALKRIVWLDLGAYLIFDETEALTIIDVNTGKFSGKADYQETVVKTNQLAAREIVRQLRLRDIGGIVLIDFIDMSREKDKQLILNTMAAELKQDEKQTKLIGFTPLGILQLTRKKTKITLSEAMQEKCPVCEGTGRILSAETVAFRLERELLEHRHSEFEAVLVETTEAVRTALLSHKDFLEQSLQLKIYFLTKPSTHHYFILKQFGDEREISQKTFD
ncbi:Rne/Rng family ribonuclease [Neobacillus thermocopriae]|uniref:Ribonuclease E/G n=1 Tax=Neobacillus thermocopriae TaxID=1215031 RepID=A0A6B3TPS2_9BACI|nr:ribonuclease E/G [Neobacillus thermocopriae]MED3623688.1 ribonuclease E/G [Neobacillus thermocopriae]MED3712907.1 ribonuclease E/G [Neobacillus thermocopriae]NEX78339.1 ribonuclease E/G [Neobacillus thermocopriae]